MSSSSPRAHDRFFKQIFSRPENIRSFIQDYLPAEIVSFLDLQSLEVVNTGFVDDQLVEYFSDIVIKTRLQRGDPAEIYFLFEHKSGPEKFVRLQILQYMASSWYTFLKEGRLKSATPLPLIIPVLVYHGTSSWKFDLKFQELFDPPSSAFEPYVPRFEHLLHDISHLNEDEVKGTIILQVTQLLFKYIRSPELRDRLPGIFALMCRLSEQDRLTEYLQIVLEYVFQATEQVDVQDIKNALQKIPQGESIMPTIAEKLRQEGRKQGMQQGMEQGMQQGMQQGERKGKTTALIKLMNRKFTLTPEEEALIQSVQDQSKLDQALEEVLFAKEKAEVLNLFR